MDRCLEIYDRIKSKGQSAIEEFIEDRKFEDLYLDFKRSSDNGEGNKLSNSDNKNLAKAISGFGNSEGGVIIWGVDCSPDIDGADVAHNKFLIHNPERFASLLQGAVSRCTVPPHNKVENHIISVDDNKGYIITLIPKSNSAPHQMLPDKKYFIRAGSDFVPTPHDVLSGMFGRRPQPHVFHHFSTGIPDLIDNVLKIGIGISIHNEGPGIASDIYCTCLSQHLPGVNSKMKFETPDTTNWSGNFAFGMQISTISAPGFRLPPGGFVQPLIIHLYLKPEFNNNLKISGSVGAGESRKYEFLLEQKAQIINEQYELFRNKIHTSSFNENEKHEITARILGLSQE